MVMFMYLECFKVYLLIHIHVRIQHKIFTFIMYCNHGVPGSSLLTESTDSTIYIVDAQRIIVSALDLATTVVTSSR